MSAAVIGASLIGLTAVPALATPAFESNGRIREVHYNDLDLTKADDQKQLERRISVAVTKVCAPYTTREEYALCRRYSLRQLREPVAQAIAQAETKADSQKVKLAAGK